MIVRSIGAAAGVTLALPILYWIFDRAPPFKLVSAEVLTERVAPGGFIQYRVTVFRYRSCPVLIETHVFDGQGRRFTLPDQRNQGQAVLGAAPSYVAVTAVPMLAAQGRGRFEVLLSYECNPLQRWWPIVIPGAAGEFEIVKP